MITKEEILNSEVRALWWKQPYGSMMLFGKQETRLWATQYRGLVLICCSKLSYTNEQQHELSGSANILKMARFFADNNHWPEEYTGKAIAIGRLTDCYTMTIHDPKRTYVLFNSRLYVHEYKDVIPIKPFDFKGVQGWKTLYKSEKEKIELL